jgi:predicted DNA-binding transcriptional regulator AlpA
LSEERTTNIDYKSSDLSYVKRADNASAKIFDKRIWRVEDVASFLGCATGHVYNLSSDEKIPKRKKRGLLYFVPDEILNWVLEGDLK